MLFFVSITIQISFADNKRKKEIRIRTEWLGSERLLWIMDRLNIGKYCQELLTTKDCTDLRLRDYNILDKYDK